MEQLKEISVSSLKEEWDLKRFKYAMIAIVVIGLIAHSFCYFNTMFSHDSTPIYVDPYSGVAIGRWFQAIYILIRGHVAIPFIFGLLSFLWLGISSYLITKILDINSKLGIFLTSAVLVANPSLTFMNATYIDGSDVFMFGILSSVIATYFSSRFRRGIWFAIPFWIIVLAIHQSEIQISIMLIIVLLIRDLMRGTPISIVLKKTIKYAIGLIYAGILYYILAKISLKLCHIPAYAMYCSAFSNSIFTANNMPSIKDICIWIVKSYGITGYYFIYPFTYAHRLVALSELFVFAFTFVILFIRSLKLQKLHMILVLGLLILLPLGGHFVYVLSMGVKHDLTIFSFLIYYILLLSCKEIWRQENNTPVTKKFTKVYAIVVVALLSLMCYCNVVYSNQIYLKKTFEYQTTYSTLLRVIDRVEQIEGYQVGKTKVVFVGTFNNGELSKKQPYFEYKGVGTWKPFSTTYPPTYYNFVNNIMSYPMNLYIDENTVISYMGNPMVQSMPTFPAIGSCRMVDDVVVVKLSNTR